MMSKKSLVKWSLLVVGSFAAAYPLLNCIEQLALQSFILRAVN